MVCHTTYYTLSYHISIIPYHTIPYTIPYHIIPYQEAFSPSSQMLYENGAVSLAQFFQFLAVGCVFLCINGVLLYPDSAIPSSDEKLPVKQPTKHEPFKKAKKHTCFRYELQKYKLCLGHMITGKKDTPCHLVKIDEKNQLMPTTSTGENISRNAKDLNCGRQPENSFHEMPLRYLDHKPLMGMKPENTMQLTSAKTAFDLSQQQNRASRIVGLMCDTNGVTYAECPTLGSCISSKNDEQGLNLNRTVKMVDVDCRNTSPNEEQKSTDAVQKACQGVQEFSNVDENPCEAKKLLGER